MNVLIVDDQPSQRSMLRHLLEDLSPELAVTDFGDPVEALLWSQKTPADLVLLDYRMPKMDGLEFARRFRRPLSQRDVPIVLITVVGDEPVRNAALEAGVSDFLVKPVRPRELRTRCKNLLALRQHQESLKTRARSLERQLLTSMHELDEREREILTRLANAAARREGGRGPNLERMARWAGLLAEALGLGDDEVRLIELAAPLHDIGMIGCPDRILAKPGPLDEDERLEVQQHTRAGYDILKGSTSRFVQTGATIALSHHERWDGSGYPEGLAGEEIPMAARVVAVADVLDALVSDRPWRAAWTLEDAVRHVEGLGGVEFDPAVTSALTRRIEQVREVHRGFQARRH
ncbi:MAG: response regulator [Lysobacteraceae bacterium]